MRFILLLQAFVLVILASPLGAQSRRAPVPSAPREATTLHFEDVTATKIVQTVPEVVGPHHKAVSAGDFDKDGDPDVAMAIAAGTFGSRVNKLYRNDNGVLVEVSGTAIIPEFATADVSRHSVFRDFDGDGWLDLLLVNDSFEFNDPVMLFINRHPGGVFSHFEEQGLQRGLGYDWSCGAAARDFNGDGHPDVTSVNYGGLGQDTLYLNDGTGNFTEVSDNQMPSETDFSVDAAAADMNGDGKLDIFVSNDGAPAYLYYNDLKGQGEEGQGDFKYGPNGTSGTQILATGIGHGAMEPADFDGDGLMDFYWSNRHPGGGDVVMQNLGVGPGGKATFEEVALPGFVTTVDSNKVTIADLNQDGRSDAIVMTADRPAILRNTSKNGVISFVDWTPANTFPSLGVHAGMSVAALDSNTDGHLDLLIGAMTDDHLFERVASPRVNESDLVGGLLPAFANDAPLAIHGSATFGEADTYDAGPLGTTGYLAVILTGSGEYLLEVLLDGIVQASSNRGGPFVEEALQVDLSPGNWTIRVTSLGWASERTHYRLEVLSRRDGQDNDLCTNAVVLGDGFTPFSNIGAQTDGPPHPLCDDFGDDQVPADVWFEYLATCTGTLTVSTCDTASYDTKIAVYKGTACPVTDANLLGCVEDTSGCANFTTTVQVPAFAGEWYKIRVGGYLGATGTGTLLVDCQ